MPKDADRPEFLDSEFMPQVGKTICDGRYQILDLLGAGGFAAVYKARDTKLGGMVAIKAMDRARSESKKFADRFYQEIRLTRQLQHYNTITIFDAATTEEGCLFMTMELVSGETLEEVLAREGALKPERVLRIVTQVLRSLAEAHALGIVHRDLKPANIMLCQLAGESDYVKVLDFGIAKALDPGMGSMKTETGMFMCTPSYASPQQLLSRKIGPSTDLYSLGLVVIEMMTGKTVMKGRSLGEIIKLQCETLPVPIPPSVARTPLGRVLKRATLKEDEGRYEDAAEMLDDLLAVDVCTLNTTAEGLSGVAEARVLAFEKTVISPSEELSKISAELQLLKEQGAQTPKRSPVLFVVILVALSAVAVVAVSVITPDSATDDSVAAITEPAVGVSEVPLAAPDQVEAEADRTGSDGEATGQGEDQVVPEAQTSVVVSEGTGLPAAGVEVPQEPIEALALANPSDEQEELDTAAESAVIEPDTVHLVVTSDPSQSNVFLEGDLLGSTPLDMEIEPWEGSARLVVRQSGYRSWRDQIEVDGTDLTIIANLSRRAPREEAANGEAPVEQAEPESTESVDPFGQVHAR